MLQVAYPTFYMTYYMLSCITLCIMLRGSVCGEM